MNFFKRLLIAFVPGLAHKERVNTFKRQLELDRQLLYYELKKEEFEKYRADKRNENLKEELDNALKLIDERIKEIKEEIEYLESKDDALTNVIESDIYNVRY